MTDRNDPSQRLLERFRDIVEGIEVYQRYLDRESSWPSTSGAESIERLAHTVGGRRHPALSAVVPIVFVAETSGACVPSGTALQSKPRPGETPRVFETMEDLVVDPEWNAMRCVPPPVPPSIDLDAKELRLRLVFSTPRPGTGTFLEITSNHRRRVYRIGRATQDGDATAVVLEAVSEAAIHDDADLSVRLLRRSARIFGWNAARQPTYRHEGKQALPALADPSEWVHPRLAAPELATDTVDVDAIDVAPTPGRAVLERGDGSVHVMEIIGVGERIRSEYGLTGRAARLTLAANRPPWSSDRIDETLRGTRVHWGDEPVVVAPIAARQTEVSGRRIRVSSRGPALPVGRWILVEERSGDETLHASLARAIGVRRNDADSVEIELDRELDRTYGADCTVSGNVGWASDGESVSETHTLGPERRIKLRRAPLARVLWNGELTHTLRVGIGDAPLQDVQSSSSWTFDEDHESIVLRYREPLVGSTPVVRVESRVGGGRKGNVPPGSLTTMVRRPAGVRAARQPLAASQGSDATPWSSFHRSAPLTVPSAEEIVTSAELVAAALRTPGVRGAVAVPHRDRPTLSVAVEPDLHGADWFLANLEAALRRRMIGRMQVRVEPAPIRYLCIDALLRARVKDTVALVLEVRARLLAELGRDRAWPGDRIARSTVVRLLREIRGVEDAVVRRFADVDPRKGLKAVDAAMNAPENVGPTAIPRRPLSPPALVFLPADVPETLRIEVEAP